MKVVVIGGGPAGMLAAISAAKEGNKVILLEKMKQCGRKLLITGKGRCNITSSLEIEEFIKNIPGNGKFLYGALHHFSNKDIIALLKKHHVEVKQERGNRIFPVSDKSVDVVQALEKELKNNKVCIKTQAKVTSIIQESSEVRGVIYETNGKLETIMAPKVILATGGRSYPMTGSTGDGYEIAKQLGHTITKIKPSLVPLTIKELGLCKELQGLSLKNVAIKLLDSINNKVIYEDFGEMIFTHFGVSGPIILSGSAHLLRVDKIEEKMKQGEIFLNLDLKPALTNEKLDLRVQKDFIEFTNRRFKNSLENLLPQKLIPVIIQKSGINPEKKVNEITKKERKEIVTLLKNFTITIEKFRPIEDAIVTAGGVSIKEINPSTMESKKVKGLYFAGEIIDVDAYTGGFNLQIAYSTGYTAGKN